MMTQPSAAHKKTGEGRPRYSQNPQPNHSFAALQAQLTPRQARTLRRLLERPAMREELDSVAGVSNAPDEVLRLRAKGLVIHCNRIDSYDRDGKHTRPGLYSLDIGSVEYARELLGGAQ